MNRRRIVFIIFVISLLVSLPSIINLLTGNFTPSKIFTENPAQDYIKSLVLRNSPEWKPIEQDLEEYIPNSTANVSISTVYGVTKKSVELHTSLVVDNKLTKEQIAGAKNVICRILNESGKRYDGIVLTGTNFKGYSFEENFNCSQ